MTKHVAPGRAIFGIYFSSAMNVVTNGARNDLPSDYTRHKIILIDTKNSKIVLLIIKIDVHSSNKL